MGGNDEPLTDVRQVICSVKRIYNLPKKYHKKLYLHVKLIQNEREENSVTTCSYNLSPSSSGEIFTSKDEIRSQIQFQNVLFVEGVILRFEVFIKQTMSRKIISRFECPLLNFIQTNGNGKESIVQMNPSGDCALVVEIIPFIQKEVFKVEAADFNQLPQFRGKIEHQQLESESETQRGSPLEPSFGSLIERQLPLTEPVDEPNFEPHSDKQTVREEAKNVIDDPGKHHKVIPDVLGFTNLDSQQVRTTVPSLPDGPFAQDLSAHISSAPDPVNVTVTVEQKLSFVTPNRISFECLDPNSEMNPTEERLEQNSATKPPIFGSLIRQNSGRKKRDSGESEGSLTRQSSLKNRKSDDTGFDHRHAVAGTDSRVSSALIRQLSGKLDTELPETKFRTELSRNALQVAALSWLEKQITNDDLTTELISPRSTGESPTPLPHQYETRSIVSPELIRKSPVVGIESKSSLKKTPRTLYSHSYSTVLEERDDVTTSALSKLFETEISSPPSTSEEMNNSFRRTAKSELNVLSPSLEFRQQQQQRSLIKRRQSISTTAPRAYFDCDSDTESQEPKPKTKQPNLISRFSSGKISIPPIEIDVEALPSPVVDDSNSDENGIFTPPAVHRRPSLGGQGIKRRNSIGSSTKRGRRTLSTIRSVQSWDERQSQADSVKANLQELITGEETLYDEFLEIGSDPGLEIWIVNMKQLSKVDDGSGLYYNHDCYLLLSISNIHSENLYSIFTWIGSKSERDKQIIVAFKAQNLSKFLGGVKIVTNREGEETDEFFEAIFGNFEVIDGAATESSLKILDKSESFRAKKMPSSQPQARLLVVTSTSHAVLSLFGGGSPAAETPSLKSIPIQRSSFQPHLALIFDTGDDLIFQWRGSLASQVSRAHVFEAALSLRSERIKQNPGCRIEVVDEDHEPEYFWQAVEDHQAPFRRFPSKGSSFGDEILSRLDDDESVPDDEEDEEEREAQDDHPEENSSLDDHPDLSPGLLSLSRQSSLSHSSPISKQSYHSKNYFNSKDMMSLSLPLTVSDETEEDEIFYDLDEIKDYCNELIDGHSEMQRRQVLSHSRILDPNMLIDIQEEEEKQKKSSFYDLNQHDVNLYRIGYVDGQLHTSRLSGINSNGENLGKPKKEMLESKGVYILDYNEEVYVWIGKLSPNELRVAGMTVAKALVEHSKESKVIKVESVNEAYEPLLFKSKFPDWYLNDLRERSAAAQGRRMLMDSTSAVSRSSREEIASHASKSFIESSVNYMSRSRSSTHRPSPSRRKKRNQIVVRSKISLHENHLYDELLERDAGNGVTVVWLIVGNELKSIPKNEHGHFWTHEAYVILYGFTPSRRQSRESDNDDNSSSDDDDEENYKPQFILYFWQGPHTKEKAYLQWKLSILPQKQEEWLKQMGEIPHEIRVDQSKEPLHFFRIFKHRYIVHVAFLDIIQRRNQAEEKVKRVQHEILKREKLRSFQNPFPSMIIRRVTGVFSPTNSRLLLNAARTTSPHHHRPPSSPEKKSKNPFLRDGSFSSIDTSVADDMTGHVTPIGKSQYQMEKVNGVLLFQVKGSGLRDDDVHAVQIEACANRLNSSDCFIAVRPYRAGKSFVWLWVGRGSQFFEQEAAGSLSIMLLRWVDQEVTGNQVRVVEEGAGEWFNRWIAKSFYRALGGFCLYTNFDLLQTPRYLRPYPLRYPQLFVCELLGDEYNITMLERFSQSDLHTAGAAILDAHFALFVWYGRNCNTALSVTSRKVAQKFRKLISSSARSSVCSSFYH
jgi:hypothetical protein